MSEGDTYFRSYLAPLAAFLERPDVTDLYVNRPGELWVETLGGTIERHDLPTLTATTLDRLSRQVAALSHQGISREHPLLAATLPDGSRIQIVAPPATRGDMAVAIRRHVASDRTLDDYAFPQAADRLGEERAKHDQADGIERLRAAVLSRRNILVSGGTSTGKTTFMNALLREVPADERLILIEDTPELRLTHANSVGLVVARSALGEARVTSVDLVTSALRMRPDRIILGELRGDEAYAFLRAINTGHPGSMTTIHADSPTGAVEQLALLVLQGGTRLNRADVRDYVRETIGVYVHLGRRGGRRYVDEVVFA